MAAWNSLLAKIKYKRDRLIDRVFSTDPQYNSSNRLHLCTIAWDNHLSLFFDIALPSLLQPGNIPSLVANGYLVSHTVYTTDVNACAEAIFHFSSNYTDPLVISYLRSIHVVQLKCQTHHDKLLEGLRIHLRTCYQNESYFFMASPDQFLGNKSLYLSFLSILGKNIWFAAGHPRVNLESISDYLKSKTTFDSPISNSELVSLAFSHLHPSAMSCFDGLFQGSSTNTTHVGLSIRQISDNIYCCVHSLPSPWLGWVAAADIKYFENTASFNNFDREWLRILTLENRIKVSGSSDLFFTIELTPTNSNHSHSIPDQLSNDLCHSRAFHNILYNHYVTTWRSN